MVFSPKLGELSTANQGNGYDQILNINGLTHTMKIQTLSAFYKLMLSVLATVFTCCNGYKIESDEVYFVDWNEARGKKKVLIRGADAKTFKALDQSRYAIDKNSVYYEEKKLAGADPKTFVSLPSYYGKDKHYAFRGASKIEGANGETFKILEGGVYSRDNKDYFFETAALHVSDIKSFKFLNEVDKYSGWAKDKTHYYIFFNKYPLADYESFTHLGKGYAKDKWQAYFEDKVVEGADPATFTVIKYGYAQDKHSKYQRSKKLN